ncbi:MAG TPA: cell division protein FtsX, partial [Clostridiales bacterium]|nr:cell division protein FtsX [Clostridiales bacterium]
MNIVNILTLRHLKLNKRRTLITVIGVALSVCMITAVATFAASFMDLLQRITIDDTGYWHICYGSLTGEEAQAMVESMERHKVDYVSREQEVGYAMLEGSKNENKPYLFLQAMDQNGFDTFNLKLTQGRLPENSNEVVISSHIGENAGVVYQIGDVIMLDIGKRVYSDYYMDQTTSFVEPTEDSKGEYLQHQFTREFTVTGIMKRPNVEPYWSPGYTVVTYLDQELPQMESKINVYGAYKRVPRSIFRKSGSIAEDAGLDPDRICFNTSLLRYHMLVTEDWILGTFYSIAAFVIILIMVGSVSLIYNAFAISISERSRHLGMLASVGATKKQKKNSVYFEGFLVWVFAIPAGLFFGTVGIGVTLKLVSPLISGMISDVHQFKLVVSPGAILISVLLSAITLFGSVWVPAKRASKISPVDAIRQSQDVKLTFKSVKTSGITKALFGFEAELALKNLKRNNKRYKATVLSLVLSIVLFLSVSSLSLM